MTQKTYIEFVKTFFFPLLLISVFFVMSSIFLTTYTPYSQEDMAHIRLGFPFGFFSQNQSRHDISFAPQYRNVGFGSPLEDRGSILWDMFFLNIIIVQMVFISILFAVHSIFPSTQKFFRFLSVKYVLLCIVFFILVISTVSFFFAKWMTPQPGMGMYAPPPTGLPTMSPTEVPTKKP